LTRPGGETIRIGTSVPSALRASTRSVTTVEGASGGYSPTRANGSPGAYA
jgi:hypothetical protein